MDETVSYLIKLGVGVLIALGLRLFNKYSLKESPKDLVDELKTLLVPALLTAVGFYASTGEPLEALQALLAAVAVPLGVTVKREGEVTPDA